MKDEEILLEIYQLMYAEADPPGDFKKMMETGETSKDGFFLDHKLSTERQQEIINQVMMKYKVHKWRRRLFEREVYLGCSPKDK